MCTLTYLPRGKEGFTLTSSRDENPARASAWVPQRYVSPAGRVALYPKDPVADGTWLLTTDYGVTICLLNGGYEKHAPEPFYRHSRGLVPIHYLEYQTPEDFASRYAFVDLEPFTLVVIDEQDSDQPLPTLAQIVWDGQAAHLAYLETDVPRIWSSATLYSPALRAWRQSLFAQWLLETPSAQWSPAILDFHLHAGGHDPENAIRMQRAQVETLSITTIHRTATSCEMVYRDLLTQKHEQLCLIS